METGVLALNRFRIRQRMRAGDRRAAVLHGFLENPENFLWTILVGNTVVNFVIFSLGVDADCAPGSGTGRSSGGRRVHRGRFYILHRLRTGCPRRFSSAIPTASRSPWPRPSGSFTGLLVALVAVVAWFSRGLLHWTGGKAFTGRLFGSRDELRFVMQESAPTSPPRRKTMINRVLDLPNLRVRHVMVPMATATTVTPVAPMSEVLALCRERNLTRVPGAGRQNPAQIAGVVNLERLLYSGRLDPAEPGARLPGTGLFSCTRNCAWRRPCAGCSAPAAAWPWSWTATSARPASSACRTCSR